MSIEKIEIENFQSHPKAEIEFDKGVNVIRGTSHHGKSSLIRALYWMIVNRPAGDEFRNWSSEKQATVSVKTRFADGRTVARIKSKGFDGYKTDDQSFKALRGSVPQEVEDITQMSDFNVRNQDDGYFLLTLSPGNIARKLNEKSGLKEIDEVAKETTRRLKKLGHDLDAVQNEIERKEETHAKLLRCAEKQGEIETLNELTFKLKPYLEKRKKKLSNWLQWYRSTLVKIRDVNKILRHSENVAELVDLLAQRDKLATRHEQIDELITRIRRTGKDCRELNEWLTIEVRFNGLKRTLENQRKLLNRYASIQTLSHEINSRRTELSMKLEHIEWKEKELESLRAKLTQCPTCGADKKHWKKEL